MIENQVNDTSYEFRAESLKLSRLFLVSTRFFAEIQKLELKKQTKQNKRERERER